jgi:hypothetical protein
LPGLTARVAEVGCPRCPAAGVLQRCGRKRSGLVGYRDDWHVRLPVSEPRSPTPGAVPEDKGL